MQHAITVKDILEWGGGVVALTAIFAIIVGVFSVLASAFKD